MPSNKKHPCPKCGTPCVGKVCRMCHDAYQPTPGHKAQLAYTWRNRKSDRGFDVRVAALLDWLRMSRVLQDAADRAFAADCAKTLIDEGVRVPATVLAIDETIRAAYVVYSHLQVMR